MWALVALALVALAARSLERSPGGRGGGGGSSFEPLSPIRKRALQILDSLLPSAYPSPKFLEIVGRAFDPLTSEGTTCGALPGRMGALLGHPTAITRYGVAGVETEGRALGAWVEARPGRRPKPGDIYLTRYPADHPTMPGWIAHTGVVESATGDIWTTADAGQGPKEAPRAEYVERRFDPQKMTLTPLAGGEPRELVGWIDLDRVRFPAAPAPGKKLPIAESADRVWEDYPHDPNETGGCLCTGPAPCGVCRGWRQT